MAEIQPGRCRHDKGNEYTVLGVARGDRKSAPVPIFSLAATRPERILRHPAGVRVPLV